MRNQSFNHSFRLYCTAVLIREQKSFDNFDQTLVDEIKDNIVKIPKNIDFSEFYKNLLDILSHIDLIDIEPPGFENWTHDFDIVQSSSLSENFCFTQVKKSNLTCVSVLPSAVKSISCTDKFDKFTRDICCFEEDVKILSSFFIVQLKSLKKILYIAFSGSVNSTWNIGLPAYSFLGIRILKSLTKYFVVNFIIKRFLILYRNFFCTDTSRNFIKLSKLASLVLTVYKVSVVFRFGKVGILVCAISLLITKTNLSLVNSYQNYYIATLFLKFIAHLTGNKSDNLVLSSIFLPHLIDFSKEFFRFRTILSSGLFACLPVCRFGESSSPKRVESFVNGEAEVAYEDNNSHDKENVYQNLGLHDHLKTVSEENAEKDFEFWAPSVKEGEQTVEEGEQPFSTQKNLNRPPEKFLKPQGILVFIENYPDDLIPFLPCEYIWLEKSCWVWLSPDEFNKRSSFVDFVETNTRQPRKRVQKENSLLDKSIFVLCTRKQLKLTQKKYFNYLLKNKEKIEKVMPDLKPLLHRVKASLRRPTYGMIINDLFIKGDEVSLENLKKELIEQGHFDEYEETPKTFSSLGNQFMHTPDSKNLTLYLLKWAVATQSIRFFAFPKRSNRILTFLKHLNFFKWRSQTKESETDSKRGEIQKFKSIHKLKSYLKNFKTSIKTSRKFIRLHKNSHF